MDVITYILRVAVVRSCPVQCRCSASVIVSSASDQYADRATALDVYGLFGQLGRAVFEHDIRSSRRRMLIRAGWSVPVDAHY